MRSLHRLFCGGYGHDGAEWVRCCGQRTFWYDEFVFRLMGLPLLHYGNYGNKLDPLSDSSEPFVNAKARNQFSRDRLYR